MLLFLGILLQDGMVVFLWVVCAFAILGFFGVILHQFILPYIHLKALELPDPISVGDSFDFVVEGSARSGRFTIGKKIANLRTLCKAIQDDHLVFDFKRNRDTEEFEITIYRNGSCLYKPPRMDLFEKMDAKEKLESYEIIGHTADFRISDKLTKDRMVNFIEVSLSSSYFFNRVGKEKMKFTFTVTKIQPGLNRKKRNRDGSYDWGQEGGSGDSEEDTRGKTDEKSRSGSGDYSDPDDLEF